MCLMERHILGSRWSVRQMRIEKELLGNRIQMRNYRDSDLVIL